MVASLSGLRGCPKKNAARGRVRTGNGAGRNQRLSPLNHSVPHTVNHIIVFIYKYI